VPRQTGPPLAQQGAGQTEKLWHEGQKQRRLGQVRSSADHPQRGDMSAAWPQFPHFLHLIPCWVHRAPLSGNAVE
jgi:hypothetical protein